MYMRRLKLCYACIPCRTCMKYPYCVIAVCSFMSASACDCSYCKVLSSEVEGINYMTKYSIAKQLLATHSTGSIGYYLCLSLLTQFQLGR